eukprot:gene9668-10655_t
MATCYGCKEIIRDKYILQVSPNLEWHQKCFKCTVCNIQLGTFQSCFMSNGRPYCKEDYERAFPAVICHNCDEVLEPNSLVMKLENDVFHVDCFRCSHCDMRLLPDEHFYTSKEDELLCASENCLKERNSCSDDCLKERNSSSDDCWSDVISNDGIVTGSNIEKNKGPSPQESGGKTGKPGAPVKTDEKSKSKDATTQKKSPKDRPTRVRTVLNEKQLSTLKRCYAANPRPDSIMKQQLVELTGLSARVIRVWFQNKRCKDKKKSMLIKANEQTTREMMQTRLSLHSSSPRSDELSLPGCSPPLPSASTPSSAVHSGSSVVDTGVQSLQMMVNDRNDYRNNAALPYQSYGVWSSYGDYQNNYQDVSYAGNPYHKFLT